MDYEPRSTVIHTSLMRVPMIAGVEKRLAIVHFSIGLAMVVWRIWMYAPVFFAVHLFLVWLTKKEESIFQIYTQYSKQPDVYDPWVRIDRRSKIKRPHGFGRDTLC
jgi:type IV secretory pathway VirB3-like protein